MKHINSWLLFVLMLASMAMSACGPKPTKAQKLAPFQLEAVEESDLKRVILTEKAAERLDIQTVAVRTQQVNGSQRKVIPYAAVLYDLEGLAWTYASPQTLIFVREPIVIESLEGDFAVLSQGPAVGTLVVIIGAAELYGAELGVSK